MARYIDIDKLQEFNCESIDCSGNGCAECYYNNGGAEDVAPVVHAKWIKKITPMGRASFCTNCDYATFVSTKKYCPNCGAKMDKQEDN